MTNDTNKISVEQAAPVLGISPNQIRYYMRNNRFDPPIGQVRKVPGITSWPEPEGGQA